MVDGLELGFQRFLSILDVKERDGACVEVSIAHLTVYDLFHQFAQAFFCIFRQASGRSFHGIGHHQYGLFLCGWIGTRVGELAVVDGLFGILILV